jgi:hypothetical protein
MWRILRAISVAGQDRLQLRAHCNFGVSQLSAAADKNACFAVNFVAQQHWLATLPCGRRCCGGNHRWGNWQRFWWLQRRKSARRLWLKIAQFLKHLGNMFRTELPGGCAAG